MKSFSLKLRKAVTVTLLLLSCFLSYPAFVTKADELSDLNKQIQDKQKEKEETLRKIKEIDKNINNIANIKGDLYSTLNSLNSQKKSLDGEIITLEKQFKEQEAILSDYLQKLGVKEGEIKENQNYLYKLTFLGPDMIFGKEENIDEYFANSIKTSASIELFKGEVQEYNQKIEEATKLKVEIESEKVSTNETKLKVNSEISKTQTEVSKYEKALADANQTKGSLNSKLNEVSSQLKFMSSRQKELLDAELAKMKANLQAQQKEIKGGEYFFMGRGRDMIEGHGLGMSQWGAYGMALQGWSYDKILTFYYSGTTISDYKEPEKIIVTGKTGEISIDEYLAGIGEVPNSWPAESIKAQVVAARTYVMGTCGNKTVCEICPTDRCQVYVGGKAKEKYVQETKGKVILYDGKPITAYYSASHRGYSSSISTVWGGSDLPYIKPVNDDAFAFKDYKSPNPYNTSQLIATYNWQWRTNGYTPEQLTTIFSKNSRTNVGNFQKIEVQKDVANRVSKITIIGDAGSKTLSGWDFRAIFNASTPFNDYVYSTEFNFFQK